MKNIFILITVMLLLPMTAERLTSSTKTNIVQTEDVKEHSNNDNSFEILKETLMCDDSKIRTLVYELQQAGIDSIQQASFIEPEENWADGNWVVLEIEQNDNELYHLYMTSDYFLRLVFDVQIQDYIYVIVL